MMAAARATTRILIGAGSFADARTAIALAEALAGLLPAEMGGVLIDEIMLAEIAQLPRQRVVTPSGMMLVAPSVAQIRTLLESDAKAFRQMLAQVARARMVKWTFERRSGDLIGGLCEAAQGWDILLLGHRALHGLAGQVILIASPGDGSDQAAQLAEDLARSLGTDVLTLTIGSGMREDRAPVSRHIDLATEDQLLTQVSRTNAAAVVVDLASGPLHTHAQLRELLGAARCPVVVLGAAMGEPALAHTTMIPPA